MSVVDPFTHMEEAWQLGANPFPPDAIRQPGQPYNPEVFAEEMDEFRRKLVRGAVLSNRTIGFLWSKGRYADTGFGKTTLMMEAANEINADLGENTLELAGMPKDRIVPLAAAYANLNNLDASGLYPVLFQALVDAAQPSTGDGPPPLLDTLAEKIHQRLGGDDRGPIVDLLLEERLRTAPGSPPLRPELANAFATGAARGVLGELSKVSAMARLRNGLQYLDFLITVCAAAEVEHVFVFVDQLEDLAQNRSITAAKRSREIGRIRDMIEMQPYAGHLHFVFTFHDQAATVLERFWEQNRLPNFDPSPGNSASMLVLRGLQREEQVAALLRTYLETARLGRPEDELLPFQEDALPVLLESSHERVGEMLAQSHQLLNVAAEQGLPKISGEFARSYLEAGGVPIAADAPPDEDVPSQSDIDDLILG